jgi:hypothetical protein
MAASIVAARKAATAGRYLGTEKELDGSPSVRRSAFRVERFIQTKLAKPKKAIIPAVTLTFCNYKGFFALYCVVFLAQLLAKRVGFAMAALLRSRCSLNNSFVQGILF